MVDNYLTQCLFFLSLFLILLLPGRTLLLAVLGRSRYLSRLEKFVLSLGLGLVSLDFLFFAYSRAGILIDRLSIVSGVLLLSLVFFGIHAFRFRRSSGKDEEKLDKKLAFSKEEIGLALLLLFAVFFLKTVYLYGTVLPTATDMGHHMYWAKEMSETGKLPNYEGMPDFIIGEHTLFGALAILSGASFFGAFPIIVLHLFNLLSILAVFILVLRIFENRKIAILSLLFLGVLYAVSSPQSKFVSGGVVGNILGNFLMPLAFYLYFLAFDFLRDKKMAIGKHSRGFLSLAVFITFGLFYTHHLTSFIFIFIVPLTLIIYSIANFQEVQEIWKKILRAVFSWPVILTFLAGLFFFFFVFTPNYVETQAVETAVGTPSKSTRVGLSLSNLESTVGGMRLGIGFVGILVLLFSFKRKNFGQAIILGWTLMILIMSTRPDFLLIDLPSSRIGNYLTYPIAILAALSFFMIFSLPEKEGLLSRGSGEALPRRMIQGAFVVVFSGLVFFGISDSTSSFKAPGDYQPLFETFRASEYLASEISDQDVVLKDHNYLTGDTWMKLFLMKGYRYPLSRSYFKRYEDPTSPREMCTLQMILAPSSQEAETCFQETRTNFVVVNPFYDGPQFEKNKGWDHVYSGNEASIYYKR